MIVQGLLYSLLAILLEDIPHDRHEIGRVRFNSESATSCVPQKLSQNQVRTVSEPDLASNKSTVRIKELGPATIDVEIDRTA